MTGPANSDTYGYDDSDGTVEIINTIETQNSHRHIKIIVDDSYDYVQKKGLWTITLTTVGSAVTYDGWINSTLGSKSATLPAGNPSKTINMPGTAAGAITVASYVTKWSWTNYLGTAYVYTGPIELETLRHPAASDQQQMAGRNRTLQHQARG